MTVLSVSSLLPSTGNIFYVMSEKSYFEKSAVVFCLRLMSTTVSYFSWNFSICYDCYLITTKLAINSYIFFPLRTQNSDVLFHLFSHSWRVTFIFTKHKLRMMATVTYSLGL